MLEGKQYRDDTRKFTKKNTNADANETSNVREITGATLVGSDVASSVLDRISGELINNTSLKVSIDEGFIPVIFGNVKFGEAKFGGVVSEESIKAGDAVEVDTEYRGIFTGRITSETFNLNGSILVKECEVEAI